MNQQSSYKLNKFYTGMLLLSAQSAFSAANFNIAPVGTLPTTVTLGQTVVANFTVTNMTNSSRNGYFITGLPTTVTQNTTSPNCANLINLAANASCNLQLDITGAVSSNFALCKGSSCTTATTPLSVTQKTSRFAYITRGGGVSPYVSLCAIDSTTGSILSCQNAGGDSVLSTAIALGGIVLNNSGTVAYMSNASNTNNTVFQCTINQATYEFDTCTSTAITSPTYQPYYGQLTLNHAETTAYLVNYGTNEVFACPIVSDAIINNCVNTNASGITSSLVQIVLNQDDSVAYIGSFGGVIRCNVSGTSFSACGSVTGDGIISFVSPTGVALNNTGSKIYVAENSSPKNIYVCSTTMNGANFNRCHVAYSNLPTGSWAITLNARNTVAYITDYINTTYTCAISAIDGTFSSCLASTDAPIPTSTALLYTLDGESNEFLSRRISVVPG